MYEIILSNGKTVIVTSGDLEKTIRKFGSRVVAVHKMEG